jgi:hypothetical protein
VVGIDRLPETRDCKIRVIRLSKNAIAQVFLLVFLMQQGIVTLAMAASQMQQVDGSAVAKMGHDCEGMGAHDDGHSGALAVTPESSQQDHQDCNDSGCDDCLGCVACAAGNLKPFNIFIISRPVVAPVYIAAAIPEPDPLYRPPITN